jgi:hypothetical protein
MIVFATSDKGGTGRSVTSANVLYRKALMGSDVVYIDFDFGSPTSGAIFAVEDATRGVERGGLHSYFHGHTPQPRRIDLWVESDRQSLHGRPTGAGRLVLVPGDLSGGEFSIVDDMVDRCISLLLRMNEEFEVCLVDLSAGRSYATQMVLAATAKILGVDARWLVFHRFTRQHIIAAEGLVFGEQGLLDTGIRYGYNRHALANAIKFVRTAVVSPDSEELVGGLRPEQLVWLSEIDRNLHALAARLKIGNTMIFGTVPLDPVLQFREQLITNADVRTRSIANAETVQAFEEIASKIHDPDAWRPL